MTQKQNRNDLKPLLGNENHIEDKLEPITSDESRKSLICLLRKHGLFTISRSFSPDFTIDENGNITPWEETVKIPIAEGTSDHEYYWQKRGECPRCRNGSKPAIMPGGWFECAKCKWRN